MVTFVETDVTVRVPATSANLGPGFDALGIAWSLHDELTARVSTSGTRVVVVGEGEGQVPLDERHLVVRSMHAAFDLLGGRPAGIELSCRNVIAHSRGMGSSSAAIVAGVVLARGLVAGGELLVDDESLFALAAEIEGHPDNVAPAFHGGFTVAGRSGDDLDGPFFAVPLSADPRVCGVLFVPAEPVATELARGLLPAQVPHAEAAADAGRAALLVAALTGRPELLHTATRDWLHQDHRAAAMPRSHALVATLRAEGVPAVISGAGPTVLAFADASQVDALAARVPAGWSVHTVQVDPHGATLV